MKYLIIALILTSCADCTKTKTVKAIGGCNLDYCGVEFTDGTFGTATQPVIGLKMCKFNTIYVHSE